MQRKYGASGREIQLYARKPAQDAQQPDTSVAAGLFSKPSTPALLVRKGLLDKGPKLRTMVWDLQMCKLVHKEIVKSRGWQRHRLPVEVDHPRMRTGGPSVAKVEQSN